MADEIWGSPYRVHRRVEPDPKRGARILVNAGHLSFLLSFFIGFAPALGLLFFSQSPVTATIMTGVVLACITYAVVLFMLAIDGGVMVPRLGVAGYLLFLFFGWLTAGVLWNEVGSRFIPAGYVGVEVLTLISVALLMQCGPADRVFRQGLLGMAVATAAILAYLVLTGTVTPDGRLGDASLLHPNVIGRQSAYAGLGAFYLLSLPRQLRPRLAVLGGLLLVLAFGVFVTTSKTSMVAFAIGVCLLTMGLRTDASLKMTVFLIIGLLFLGTLGMTMSYFDEYFANETDGITTLTGRTFIWEKSWEMIKERPLMGYGTHSFRLLGPTLSEFQPVHTHNELLQVWFTTGLIGVLLALGSYIALWVLAIRRMVVPATRSLGMYAMAMMACTLIFGLTEAGTSNLVLPTVFAILMALGLRPGSIGTNARDVKAEKGRGE